LQDRFWSTPWESSEADRQIHTGLEALYEGRLDPAVAAFNVALAKDPECVKVHEYLGLAYRFRGNGETALSHFNLVIERAPAADGPALEQRAILMFRSGNRRAALADCDRILKEVAEPDLQQWAAKQIKAHP